MSELVAVTGGDGFIGSHLVEALVRAGHRVRAMALYNSLGSWGWLDELSPEIMASVEVQMGDVRDRECVLTFMRDVSVVYNLAALIAIPYSYQAPSSYLETNALGTMNVLEAARTLGTSRVVQTSTSEVYGTARFVPMDEYHPLQAQSPYAASKIAADKLAESYHLSFELPVVVLRPFNTYGPRQSARAVIAALIAQVCAGKKTVQVGSLDPVRDFNFAADTAAAFVAVGTAPAEHVVGQVLNAGSGVGISIGDLIKLVGQVMGKELEPVLDPQRVRPAGSEVMRLICDSTMLQKVTGWKPAHNLEQGISITAEWFSNPANLRRYRTDVYNV